MAQCDVYVFDVATGQQLHKLTASDSMPYDYFGSDIALDGNIAVIGAFAADDNGSASGKAYIYDITTGQELHVLLPSDGTASDFFGAAVSVSGDVAVIGANGYGGARGSAYIFDVATGQEVHKLAASDSRLDDSYGTSVAADGDLVAIGATKQYYGGAVYLYDAATGQERASLVPLDVASYDQFGWDVAISGDRGIFSARRDGDFGEYSGSAYVFDVPEPTTLGLMALGALTLLRKRRWAAPP